MAQDPNKASMRELLRQADDMRVPPRAEAFAPVRLPRAEDTLEHDIAATVRTLPARRDPLDPAAAELVSKGIVMSAEKAAEEARAAAQKVFDEAEALKAEVDAAADALVREMKQIAEDIAAKQAKLREMAAGIRAALVLARAPAVAAAIVKGDDLAG